MQLKPESVIVIGSSLAGLYCAQELAKRGVSVSVYEQHASLREIPGRTLIVTPEFRSFWPMRIGPRVKNTIRAFRVNAGGTCIEIPVAEPDLVVDRRDLIAAMADQAERVGVQFHFGTQLLSVAPVDDRIDLLFLDRRAGRIFRRSVTTLIGADGARSIVARSMDCNGRLAVPILQAQIRSSGSIDRHVVDTWFMPERTPYFFWRIPDSDHTAAVGFVAPSSRLARREFFRFLEEQNYEPVAIEAALVPLYEPGEKPYLRFGKAAVYLVGDSAGHVKVTTVGGTVTGLAGAAAAVRSILNGTDYWKELKSLRWELNVHYWIRKAMGHFDTNDYVHLIRALNGRVLQLLRDTNRDRFSSVFVQMLFIQPRLAVLGARALLRGRLLGKR